LEASALTTASSLKRYAKTMTAPAADSKWETLMRVAMRVAAESGEDVPVGALLVNGQGEVEATGCNCKELESDASAHAEIVAIRVLGADRSDWRLEDCTLVVTLEPCVMCAGAIVAARIPRVVFGAWDERVGAAGSAYDILRDRRLGNPIEVIGGVLEAECSQQLKQFFAGQRG
jgi:tRNA(adenine34) deaminase